MQSFFSVDWCAPSLEALKGKIVMTKILQAIAILAIPLITILIFSHKPQEKIVKQPILHIESTATHIMGQRLTDNGPRLCMVRSDCPLPKSWTPMFVFDSERGINIYAYVKSRSK